MTASTLDIRRVAGRIGAEIRGIKLSANLDADTKQAIRQALYQHKVIFFRGQHHLDDAQQEALTSLFGEPVAHPTVPVADGTDYVLELDSRHGGRANTWHTDVTFDVAYPQASILRALQVPEYGGDTVWANTATAYQELPESLRELADKLWATHGNDYDYAATRTDVSEESLKRYREVFTSKLYETEHPLVRVHPETGERTLVLGHFLKRIVGLSSQDSQHLFNVLQNHVIRLENTVRWSWQNGDVAIWDNRATQHYAINDYGDQTRILHRVTVAGDLPVSVDGRHSVSRSIVPNQKAANTEGEGQTAAA